MVIRPDWRHFWSPLVDRLRRGTRAMLVILFVTVVWFLLRFEVAVYVDSPLVELLLLIVELMLIVCWFLVLLLVLLGAVLLAMLLGERLELQDGVVMHGVLLRAAERVVVANGARLRCGIRRGRRTVDVLESIHAKTQVVVSRRVFGPRLDLFWTHAGLEPQASEPLS